MEQQCQAHIYFGLKPFLTLNSVDEKLKSLLEKDFFKKKRKLYKFADGDCLIDFGQVTHIEFREVKDG